MSIYREVLLDIENNFIESRQMDAQKKFQFQFLLIGLEGIGVGYLEILKRYTYSKIQPNNQNDVGALFMLVYQLSYWLKNKNKYRSRLGIQSASFYIERKNIYDTHHLGRYLISEKVGLPVEKEQRLRYGKEAVIPVKSNINIHIYTSISEGTGTNPFLDIYHLVHQAMEIEKQLKLAFCCVYFCLPNINLSVSQISKNSTFNNINKYAVVKKRNYYMNFKSIIGKCDEQHMKFFFEPSNKLSIKNYYRISETITRGFSLNKVYNYTVNVVGDYTMKFVVENIRIIWEHLYSWSVNVKKRNIDCLLGMSKVVVPISKIKLYLASDFFADISQRKEKISIDDKITQIMYNSDPDYYEFQNSIIKPICCKITLIELECRKSTLISNKEESGLKGKLILSEIIEKMQQNMVDLLIKVNIQVLIQEWSEHRVKVEKRKVYPKYTIFIPLVFALGWR